MSDLYELLFRDGSKGWPWVAALEFTSLVDVGRYRSAWIERDPDRDGYRIAVYTRNGGPNRADPHDPDCGRSVCIPCIMHNRLPAHPRYLSQRDDDFDHTYATVYFRPTDEQERATLEFERDNDRVIPDAIDTSQRWRDKLAEVEKSPPQDVLEAAAALLERIEQQTGPIIIVDGDYPGLDR